MPLDAREDDDHPELLGQHVNRLPEPLGAVAGRERLGSAWTCIGFSVRLERFAAIGRTIPIDGEPPGHACQPRAEPRPIAQLPEVAVRFGERLLRHVLGILALAQNAIGDPERQRRRLHEPGLEFPLELAVHAYEAAGQPVRTLMHRHAFILARRRPGPGGSGQGGKGR